MNVVTFKRTSPRLRTNLAQPAPRPSRVKASLAAIGRVAGTAGLEVVKAAVDGAVGAVMRSLGAS
jgi:hypothetical protein